MKIGCRTSPTVFFGQASFNTLAGTVIVYTCSIIHHVWFFVCMNTIIKLKEEAFIMAGTLFDTSEDHPKSTGVYRNK